MRFSSPVRSWHVWTLVCLFLVWPAQGESGIPDLDELRTLAEEGLYKEVERQAPLLLAHVDEEYGENSPEAADVLEVLVDALVRTGKGAEPETLASASRALRIREQWSGMDHPRLVPILSTLGVLHDLSGNGGEALECLERALRIRREDPDSNQPAVVAYLAAVAESLIDNHGLAAARTVFERLLGLQEASDGPDSIAVADTLIKLGQLLSYQGQDLNQAASYYGRALAIREAAFGPQHESVGLAVRWYGLAMFNLGRYSEALSATERDISILEHLEETDERELSTALNNYGVLLLRLGYPTQAREVLERACSLNREVREGAGSPTETGEDRLNLALCLTNLASAIQAMGLYDGAEPLLDRARSLCETTGKEGSLYLSWTLIILARNSIGRGDLDRARTLYGRAVTLREDKLGPDSLAVANALVNLGSVLEESGDHLGAKSAYERVLDVYEKQGLPEHPNTAKALNGLAALALSSGHPEDAERYYRRALEIRERFLGPDHPLVASTLAGLGRVLSERGDKGDALDVAVRAESIGREHFRLIARALPEGQALDYAESRVSSLDLIIDLAGRSKEPTSRERSWDAVIRSRAVVFDEMARRHRHAYDSGELEGLTRELGKVRQRLANLMVRGPEGVPPERYRSLIGEVRRNRDEAERALAEKSARFRSERASRDIGFRQVVEALPPESGLLAYVRYEHHAPGPREKPGTDATVPSYLAFVLGPSSRSPVAIPLGSADEIDKSIASWKAAVSTAPKPLKKDARNAERETGRAGDVLRRKIWDPALEHLAGAKQVFVVPDGQTHLVNLGALPSDKGHYLVETGPSIHYVSAERDLVLRGSGKGGRGLLALGGADFDGRGGMASEGVDDSSTFMVRESNRDLPYRGPVSSCSEFDALRFEYLPGTEEEVKEVATTWTRLFLSDSASSPNDVLVFSGPYAHEALFKMHAPSRDVLHVASHGFFLDAGCRAGSPGGTSVGSPLLLSGLALAGANNRSQVEEGEEDGILTAEEIAALDLSNVRLAVLSACRTGSGRVMNGEGVLGLRRAFRIAGVDTLIMSLWSVEDQTTKQWMQEFYHASLESGLPTSEAVRQATLQLLRDRREAGRSTHPFFWGPFVAAGDWR